MGCGCDSGGGGFRLGRGAEQLIGSAGQGSAEGACERMLGNGIMKVGADAHGERGSDGQDGVAHIVIRPGPFLANLH